MLVDIWSKVLETLQTELSGPGYQTFISSTSPLSFDDNVLTLQVANRFSMDWIKEKCETRIRESLEKQGFYPVIISYQVSDSSPKEVEDQISLIQPSVKSPDLTAMLTQNILLITLSSDIITGLHMPLQKPSQKRRQRRTILSLYMDRSV